MFIKNNFDLERNIFSKYSKNFFDIIYKVATSDKLLFSLILFSLVIYFLIAIVIIVFK